MKKLILLMAAFLSCSVTAGAVVIDSTKAENDTVLYINRDTLDDLENKIEGCVVTYSKSGDASIYAAFYENETLKGVALNSVNLEKGNNDFTINIDNPEKYSDCNLRFYVWDSNMTPVLTKETQFYRTETFSDEYEPYYPMLTAQIKTVDEIYQSTLPTSFELTQNQKDVRWQVVKMYKDAGFDITDGISPEGVDDEKKAIFNIPSGWSTLTPKSLVGNYEQMYSIDACFNRKIPEAAPMVELNDEVINFENLHIAVNNTPAARGGQGTGIARVIGRENDPLKTVMARWNAAVYAPQALYRLHVPENAGDFLNINPSSDRHAIFIDDTERVAVHIYEAVPPTGVFPYDLDTGRIPGFFIRGAASGNLIELTGIGAEGISGGYATGVVADGYTVKSNEIKNPDTMINHAVSAAINPVMFGRIYPALTSDAGGVNDASNFGAVPEGGVIRLDPEYNLEALYNSQKLSLPSYKILKAVQEYGLYNVDRGGYGKGKGVMLYTSTNKSDWYNEDDISFNVPYANNEQGYEAVTKEIVAFMAGDEYFGEEKPKLYVTIPVVKYAKLDIDKNGIIEEADMNIVSEAKVYNKEYDVNCDGIIDYKDKRVYENYFADLPQHKNAEDLCTLTVTSIDTRGGKVMVRGAAYDESGNGRKFKIKKGQLVTISAVEYTGWEFDRWSGDFEGIDDNIITIRADRDYNISPQYTRKTSYKLNVKAYNQAFIPDKAIETLMAHDFVPCEGGEHAIADQYMFAYLVKGKQALDEGSVEEAIKFFREGQMLPQSLGAGIWNHCKLIPLKYHEALCLEILNKKDEAYEIFDYIANVTIEYFSNMHLKELPYWQAKSFEHLGEHTKAQHLMAKYLREWKQIKNTVDNGYFGTTPFFIPFMDEPQRLRQAQYLYLMSLCADYIIVL